MSATSPSAPGPGSGGDASGSGGGLGHDLAHRIAAVERRLAALEETVGVDAPPRAGGDPTGRSESLPDLPADTFWALQGLRERVGEDGGVLVTGTVTLPTGEVAEWQQGATTSSLLDTEDDEAAWDRVAEATAALGHPARLRLLRAVLSGTRTAADLGALEGLGTSGQVYHHLRTLVAAGWLRSTGRGRYEVPAARVVPLLSVLAVAQR
jgi:DNA-binding transcriptional ArsR family regulator